MWISTQIFSFIVSINFYLTSIGSFWSDEGDKLWNAFLSTLSSIFGDLALIVTFYEHFKRQYSDCQPEFSAKKEYGKIFNYEMTLPTNEKQKCFVLQNKKKHFGWLATCASPTKAFIFPIFDLKLAYLLHTYIKKLIIKCPSLSAIKFADSPWPIFRTPIR